jgi:CheY-like chemotaxis protein
MGGEISVESEPGNGSIFRFTITCGVPAESQHQGRQPQSLPGFKALIVDDNANSRSILQGFCTSWEMECRSAGDGATALDILADGSRTGWIPNVILLDLTMPGMDGWELSSLIRSLPDLSTCRIIIMARTVAGGDSELRNSLSIDSYLLKPFIQDELYDTIRQVLAIGPAIQSETRQAPARVHAESQQRGLSILVAEDVAINQKLVKRMLEKMGHSVAMANNGAEALDLWQTSHFDLIFMDIEMPEMDGYQTTSAIRTNENERGGHVPIIAMTAHALQGDDEKCLAAGMDAYLSKPFKSSELAAAIATLRGISEQEQSVPQQQQL